MSIAHIYIDEYGTPDLDTTKSGVTPYFVYAAVVIEQAELANARQIHQSILTRYFGGTHMKSKNIPNDDNGHAKRMKILAELSHINHYVVALLVDKEKVDSVGLEHKKSFIKFFNNLISTQFMGKFDEYHINLDKLGRKSFQESLTEYMGSKGHRQTLFSNNTFCLKDDITEEPLIQLSDFYSGCIGKYYCGNINKNQSEAIHNTIKSRLFLEWFPKEFINFFGAAAFQNDGFNPQIAQIAINSANKYLEDYTDEIGCEITKLLLQETYLNPCKYISSGEIKRKISTKGIKIGDPINEIAKLRDKGVFIVSPLGKKGYKFPSNEKEIAEFFDRLTSNVIPQLRRGHILHRVLVEQSFSQYNILENEKFSLLNTLITNAVTHR